MSLPECDIDAGNRHAPIHVATSLAKEILVSELIKNGADITKVAYDINKVATKCFQSRINYF